MSQWTSPGRIVTGLVGLTAVVAALASATSSQRAQSLGLTQHGQIITAQDAGAADAVSAVAVTPGTVGQVLTVSDAGLPHWAAAPSSGGGITVTTYYAASFTAVAGSDSASVSGTGSTSTLVLTTGSTARTYGSGGVTAPRAILALPAGTRLVEVDLQVVSLTGGSTGGFRYVTFAVQDVASGVPTALWGVSAPDATATYAGSLLSGGNGGTNIGSTLAVAGAADRWIRATLALTDVRLSVLHGTGSAGARPTVWTPPTSPGLPSSSGYGSIPDTAGTSWLVIVYQSFGSGSANTITLRPTVRVTT